MWLSLFSTELSIWMVWLFFLASEDLYQDFNLCSALGGIQR